MFPVEFKIKKKQCLQSNQKKKIFFEKSQNKKKKTKCVVFRSLSFSTKSTENASSDEPEIILPPSPRPATSTASHSRRNYRNDKPNRYGKNQTIGTSNLATPRRPLRTPTSSPLTLGSGLDFISTRSRFVSI